MASLDQTTVAAGLIGAALLAAPIAVMAATPATATAPAPSAKPAATPAKPTPSDEAQIRALENRFIAALKAGNVDGVMKAYARGDSLFVFDVTPPRQYVGFEAYKKDFEGFVSSFKPPINAAISDLAIKVSGDMAYSHSIQRVWGTDAKGAASDVTVRVTDVYRKLPAGWKIVHEHVSIPVDLATGKADPTSAP